ncbi:hypothetical protein BIY23_01375 [Wolbachia pipientis]|uniref:DUF4166 domain-containing protein n=1 Tax=Wolbachia pipientis TaxID=955 RepID=A0A1E7QL29_WOLPI|nr:DUF4166 domain-containing protein [Wolbachia pipientis]OEY87117.1 hypothetical protein BIY23_01375 [Wolbachia pipientis]
MFVSVFDKKWEDLPKVLKKRYANRAYSDDLVIVDGNLDVHCSWLIYILKPLLKLFNVLVPHQGKNVPVSVSLLSKPDSDVVYFNRTFFFNGRKPYLFYSKMVRIKGDDVIEFMNFGIGWRMRCFYNGKKVVLQHKGYVWKLLGILVPLPLNLLIGKGYAEEEAISDNEFRMYFEIRHRLFGKIYGYDGNFIIRE